MKILVKRAYDEAAKGDGWRVLVDRLWPRGVSKEKADLDFWAKDVTPSSALRDWYHADKEARFKEFTKKYLVELKAMPDSVFTPFQHHQIITLITANKDVEHSHIPTLEAFLSKKL